MRSDTQGNSEYDADGLIQLRPLAPVPNLAAEVVTLVDRCNSVVVGYQPWSKWHPIPAFDDATNERRAIEYLQAKGEGRREAQDRAERVARGFAFLAVAAGDGSWQHEALKAATTTASNLQEPVDADRLMREWPSARAVLTVAELKLRSCEKPETAVRADGTAEAAEFVRWVEEGKAGAKYAIPLLTILEPEAECRSLEWACNRMDGRGNHENSTVRQGCVGTLKKLGYINALAGSGNGLKVTDKWRAAKDTPNIIALILKGKAGDQA